MTATDPWSVLLLQSHLSNYMLQKRPEPWGTHLHLCQNVLKSTSSSLNKAEQSGFMCYFLMLTSSSKPTWWKQRITFWNCSIDLSHIERKPTKTNQFWRLEHWRNTLDVRSNSLKMLKNSEKKSDMETLTSCVSFTRSWACFVECVIKN